MGKSANQKRKILLIERMLTGADESCPIAMREILERLGQAGIQAERKSVYADLEELRAVGMEISFRKSQPSGYYLPEGSVRCQEAKKAEQGAEKKAEDSAGVETETVPGQEPEKQADGQGPQEPEKAAGSEKEQRWPDGIRAWERPQGEYREIQLRCRKSAYDAVLGRYGENCRVLKEDEKQFLVTAPEAPGYSFYGWLVAQGGAVRPVKPKETVKEYRKLLKKILESYK